MDIETRIKKQQLCMAILDSNKENRYDGGIPGCFGRQNRNKKKALRDVNCLSPRKTFPNDKHTSGDKKLPPLPPPRSTSEKENGGLSLSVNTSMSLENISMVIKRTNGGYGFTVTGGSPACIGRVDPDSPADIGGLKKLDAVVSINGQNVFAASADMVAKFVRSSANLINIDVQRFVRTSVTALTNTSGFPSAWDSDSVADSEMTTAPSMGAPWHHSRTSMLCHEGSDMDYDDDKTMLKNSAAFRPTYTKPTSHLSAFQNPTFDPYESRVPKPHHPPTGAECCSSQLSEDTCSPTCTPALSDFTKYPVGTAQPKQRHNSSSETRNTLSYQDLTYQEQERQTSIRMLIQLETNFVRDMEAAVSQYGRPLRHSILTPSLYTTLFQNVEKIISFSEMNVKRLKESALNYWEPENSTQHYIDSVGTVYHSNAKFLSDILHIYYQGVAQAEELWADLRQTEQVQQFEKNYMMNPKVLTMDSFLRRPVEHMRELTSHLDNILSQTPFKHYDYRELRPVVLMLKSCCQGTSTFTFVNRRSTSSSSVSSRTSQSSRSSSGYSSKASASEVSQSKSFCSDLSHSRSCSSDTSSTTTSSTTTSSVASSHIDSDLVELQHRLIVPVEAMHFQVAVPSRHIIYSAELLLVEGTKLCKLWGILCSDMLLITKHQPATDTLVLVSKPLYFTDIHDYNFSTVHPSEFQLSVTKHDLGTMVILFRATSLEQKCTWRSLLEQRLTSARSRSSLIDNDPEDAMSLATHLTFL